MSCLFKLFKIPGPKALGKASSNALPSRNISPGEKGYCWEDYYMDIKTQYPVKYFFAKTLYEFLLYKIWYKIKFPISEMYSWFKGNYIPKYKYHLLDLRQPKGTCDEYRYGWTDVVNKMLYANFNLLQEFLNEKPYDLAKDYSLEEIMKDDLLKHQYLFLQEAKFLNHWWKVLRKERYEENSKLFDMASLNKDNPDKYREFMDAYLKESERFQLEEDEMLLRLIKIRKNLWT